MSDHNSPATSLDNIHDLSSDSNFILLRKSNRIHKPPSYLSAYKCNTIFKIQHWCNLVHVPSSAFTASKCQITEPRSYKDASSISIWVEAMQTELQALHANP